MIQSISIIFALFFLLIGCSEAQTEVEEQETLFQTKQLPSSDPGSEGEPSVVQGLPDLNSADLSGQRPAAATGTNLVKFEIDSKYAAETVEAYIRNKPETKAILIETHKEHNTFLITGQSDAAFDLVVTANNEQGEKEGTIISDILPGPGTVDLGRISLYKLGTIVGNVQYNVASRNDHSDIVVKVPGFSTQATTNEKGDFELFPYFPNKPFELHLTSLSFKTKVIENVLLKNEEVFDIGKHKLDLVLKYDVQVDTSDGKRIYDKNEVDLKFNLPEEIVRFKVSLDPSFSNSSSMVVRDTYTISNLQKGSNTIYTRFYDKNVFEQAGPSIEIVVDTENPVIKDFELILAERPDQRLHYLPNKLLALSQLEYEDESPISYRISNNRNKLDKITYTPWNEESNLNPTQIESNLGSSTFWIQIKDSLGRESGVFKKEIHSQKLKGIHRNFLSQTDVQVQRAQSNQKRYLCLLRRLFL